MKKIKKRVLIGAMTFLLPVFATAQEVAESFYLDNPTLVRNGDLMSVGMNYDFSDLHLKSNQALIYTPMIVNGSDTLKLTSVGVYGRTAWYQYRRGILKTIDDKSQIPLRYNKHPEYLAYNQNVNYQEWMNGSGLVIKKDLYGCASCKEGESVSETLVAYNEAPQLFEPHLIYQAAVAEGVKTRELSGRAYVDFPVNKIVIYPEYRNNTYELGKIIATIDSVKNDPDITVTSIHIAGTASPEGPYENNVYLAKNRTIALKDYVTNLYSFPKDFIQTDYDPVDWKGLRDWLENNNLNHKTEILAIVNSSIEPYARNSKIKTDFPTEYEWLLRNVYPALRHSDYRIEYNIREFTDIAEISELIKIKPQKLSLNEMYLLASSLEEGSPEFNEVFEIAVRMYPNDEVANLNAANNALSIGDLNKAANYLAKAGNSKEAVYARGVLSALEGNFEKGIEYVEKAISMGLTDNNDLLESMKNAAKFNKN